MIRFSKKIKLETDSVFSFICSLLILVVFAPFRLTINLSKRIVFLAREGIDKMLFLSVLIGVVLTIASTVVQLIQGRFSLLNGTFPIILMIAGCIILVLLYFAFSSAKLIAYSSSRSAEMTNVFSNESGNEEKEQLSSKEQNLDDNALNDITSLDLNLEEEFSFLEDLPVDTSIVDGIQVNETDNIFTDDFVAKPNEEILHSIDVSNFQNRIKKKVDNLVTSGIDEKLSDTDMLELKGRLEQCTEGTFSKKLSSVFAEQIVMNDECMLSDEINDIPDDYELCT